MDMENLIATLQGNLKNCRVFGPVPKPCLGRRGRCLQNRPVNFLESAAKVPIVLSVTHYSAPSLTTLEFVSDSLCRFSSTKKRD